jgi:hypothetical protein
MRYKPGFRRDRIIGWLLESFSFIYIIAETPTIFSDKPMDRWSRQRYEDEKRSFIQRRIHLSPLWGQFTLMFALSWGAAWLCSWSLLLFFSNGHEWARSMPTRYAIALLFAYACFFVVVRVWIETAKREPEQQEQLDISTGAGAPDAEGCAVMIVVLVAGFIVGGLFLVIGGAPILLEVAFEAAFAGVLVKRPLASDIMLGDWKMRLFKNTWKKVLFVFLIIVSAAAWLQHQVPEAHTFAAALLQLLWE